MNLHQETNLKQDFYFFFSEDFKIKYLCCPVTVEFIREEHLFQRPTTQPVQLGSRIVVGNDFIGASHLVIKLVDFYISFVF